MLNLNVPDMALLDDLANCERKPRDYGICPLR